MTDDYIADLITEELRESCPGPEGCHGCQSWCPKCGSVPHVCDDPECDAHRRDTDVLRDLEMSRRRTVSLAIECKMLEEKMRMSSVGNPVGAMDGDLRGSLRYELRRMASHYREAEKETLELETELVEVTAPGSNLVPRKEGSKFRPRDR